MRKSILIFLVIIVSIFTFNEKEIYKKDIRNRLVIQGIGIDIEKDNSYTVTLQTIDTNAQSASSEDGASQPPIKTYKLTGDTIYTTIKSVTEIEGKIPLYSQNRIIVLGKSITEDKMDDVIDFFVRDVENSASVYIAAAKDRASDILEAKNEEDYVSARSIEIGISANEYDARIFGTGLYELINRYNSGSKDFAMPLLDVTEKQGEKSIEIIGTAIFNNTRYREYMSKEETVYLNFLADKVYNTAISLYRDNGEKISLNVVDSKTYRTLKFENGKPTFKIKVTISADIAEISGGVSKKMTGQDVEKIKTSAEEYLEKAITQTRKKLYEEYESDACGLGRLLYIFKPSFYRKNEKNIDSVMQDSIFEVDVDLKIRRIGHEFIEMV